MSVRVGTVSVGERNVTHIVGTGAAFMALRAADEKNSVMSELLRQARYEAGARRRRVEHTPRSCATLDVA